MLSALGFVFTHKNKFFLFIINLRILSFGQIGFSLHPMQEPKHSGLPQQNSQPLIRALVEFRDRKYWTNPYWEGSGQFEGLALGHDESYY